MSSPASRSALALLLLAVAWGPSRAAFGKEAPALPETVVGGRISGDVRLSGRVRIAEDVVVLPGARLSLAPGTVLSADRSDSTKVEPEYFFGGVEIVVRGELRSENAEFRFPDRTGGIVVAEGGSASFRDSAIAGAECGLVAAGGAVSAEGTLVIRGCRVGAAVFPGARIVRQDGGRLRLEGNGVGAVRFPRASGDLDGAAFGGNEEIDLLSWDAPPGDARAPAVHPAPARGATRIGDTFLEKDRTLSGDVIVDGIVRVAPGATLAIEPGSRLFFTFRDTDGDGIGENGIFLQGNLLCRGTRERRIGFYPLDGAGRGRWDSVNFMASDRGENVLEHVDIAGAYRGLHAHFSRLRAADVRILGSFRAVQFQESEVEMAGVEIVDAWSALRCRDSNVRIDGFVVRDVLSGVNVFRSAARIASARLDGPGWYGFRFRDSRAEFTGGEVFRGFVAYSVQDGEATLAALSADEPGLAGFALLGGDVKITGCRAAGSRVDGVSATRARAVLSGGALEGFARHAIKLGGPADVTLRGVKLGPAAGPAKKPVILDGKVQPGLGIVKVE